MKTIPVSLIVAAVLAPAMVCGESSGDARPPEKRDGAGKRGGERAPGDFWKKVDKNQDGFISREEFALMPRIENLPEEKRDNLFKRLDKDGDGKVAKGELGGMGRPHDGKGPPMQRLWELDADKSGGVSPEEFKAGRFYQKLPPEKQIRIFERLDTDKDGLITPKDKPEPPFKRPGGGKGPKHGEGKPGGPRQEPRAMLRQLDQNSDGGISFEEFRQSPMAKNLTEDQQEDRFEAMDKNHDQKLTVDDLPPRDEKMPDGSGAGPQTGDSSPPAAK